MTSSKPFGLRTFVQGKKVPFKDSVTLYQNGGVGYTTISALSKNVDLVDLYKVLIPALGSGSDSFPHPILGKPFVAQPNSACTETYIVIGAYDNLKQCEGLISYVSTKLFRFLVLLKKNTQHATGKVYQFVPVQDFNQEWTDEKLYKRYGLTPEETDFIDAMIRPMD